MRAWTGAGFEPADPAEHGANDLILAADSWLVVDGASVSDEGEFEIELEVTP